RAGGGAARPAHERPLGAVGRALPAPSGPHQPPLRGIAPGLPAAGAGLWAAAGRRAPLSGGARRAVLEDQAARTRHGVPSDARHGAGARVGRARVPGHRHRRRPLRARGPALQESVGGGAAHYRYPVVRAQVLRAEGGQGEQAMSAPILTSPKRCAVYCRVSSDERLDQSFNSVDAQREAGHAFIKSQSHEGWIAVADDYDDGGYSGGNMERPALKRLLAEIEAGRIDIVVVYKIDRLTRSLADFAKMVELFDRHGVSFSAVTQQINSATSMGRLMLNVLLSFAQFEREVTGERIRDKIAASKAKGMWVGGPLPLGYDPPADGTRKLVVNESEAETIRYIFSRYLELGSVHALQRDLDARGIVSKAR